jgi:predicted Zn-dependent protease
MGHIIDQGCPADNRPSSGLDELLAAVLAGGRAAWPAGGQKTCEARADEIGLQFAAGAGYNPYDCAAFFGRMLMFQGDAGLLRKWVYASTHPLNAERILHLRQTLIRYCNRFPDSCR